MSLHALRQAARLTLGAGCPSIVQDVPLAPPVIEALAADTTTPVPSYSPTIVA